MANDLIDGWFILTKLCKHSSPFTPIMMFNYFVTYDRTDNTVYHFLYFIDEHCHKHNWWRIIKNMFTRCAKMEEDYYREDEQKLTPKTIKNCIMQNSRTSLPIQRSWNDTNCWRYVYQIGQETKKVAFFHCIRTMFKRDLNGVFGNLTIVRHSLLKNVTFVCSLRRSC